MNSISYINVINRVVLASQRKTFFTKLNYSKKKLKIIKFLHRMGVIFRFKVFRMGGVRKILISLFFYKNTFFFKSIRFISTPSKKFYISLKALNIIKQTLVGTQLVLSNSSGIMLSSEALAKKKGGLMILSLY